jgi:hypothetical protein
MACRPCTTGRDIGTVDGRARRGAGRAHVRDRGRAGGGRIARLDRRQAGGRSSIALTRADRPAASNARAAS